MTNELPAFVKVLRASAVALDPTDLVNRQTYETLASVKPFIRHEQRRNPLTRLTEITSFVIVVSDLEAFYDFIESFKEMQETVNALSAQYGIFRSRRDGRLETTGERRNNG